MFICNFMIGRNKNRPWVNVLPKDKKLCPQLWSVPVGQTSSRECCTFENCKFSHNAQDILANKPPDLGSNCHTYEMYGKCRYGVICRLEIDYFLVTLFLKFGSKESSYE